MVSADYPQFGRCGLLGLTSPRTGAFTSRRASLWFLVLLFEREFIDSASSGPVRSRID